MLLVACVTPHRDPVTVAEYTFDVQLDEELTEGAPKDRPREVVQRTLEKSLGRMREDYPAAFAREMPRVQRVEVRHLGGEVIEVVTVLRDPRAELRGGDVARALEMDFFRQVDEGFRARAPDHITAAEASDWFDWERLRDLNSDRVTSDVLRFAAAALNVDRRIHRFLADHAEREDVFTFLAATLGPDIFRPFVASATSTDEGTKRLGDLLRARNDPHLNEIALDAASGPVKREALKRALAE